jgi:signal transduction histidine kinase
MRVRSLVAGLAVPVLLVGLVVVLATLQYRWIGQVSEAERAQLQKSLTQRAREFGDDFDGEITRLYLALQTQVDPLTGPPSAALPAALDGWRASARFPQIVGAIYLAEPQGAGYSLRPYDQAGRAFASAPVAWPDKLAPLRDRLTGSHQSIARTSAAGGGQLIAISAPPLLPAIPAIVIPVPASAPANEPVVPHADDTARFQVSGVATGGRGGGSPPAPGERRMQVHGTFSGSGGDVVLGGTASDALTRGAVRRLQGPRAYLVVVVDAAELGKTMLPALVARHFLADDSTPYRITVRAEDGTMVYSRGVPAGEPLLPMRYDVMLAFFQVRPEIVHARGAPAVTVTGKAAPDGTPTEAAGVSVVPAPGAEPHQFSIFVQQWSTNSRSAGGDGRVAMSRTVMPAGGWQIMLQHAAGSLDIAVAQARRRNLALSYGILSVLAVGVMLVVVNARRAQRLAARQMDFVATVTHELRTPLAVIRSAAQNLSAGVVGEPAQTRTYGDLIDKEGLRLTDMVEQVLAYAGLEGGPAPRMTQRVDLSHLVNDALDACQPLCNDAGITVEFDAEAAAGAPAVTGDEAGLRLVIQNLVGNAVKHGADGRWIGVSVTSVMHHGRPEACVTVTDRGRGIDATELAHVFEPFYRGRRALDDQIRGNGLGLSLVKRIVEAHGGRVAGESSPGAGSTFTVCLPIAAAESRT